MLQYTSKFMHDENFYMQGSLHMCYIYKLFIYICPGLQEIMDTGNYHD